MVRHSLLRSPPDKTCPAEHLYSTTLPVLLLILPLLGTPGTPHSRVRLTVVQYSTRQDTRYIFMSAVFTTDYCTDSQEI